MGKPIRVLVVDDDMGMLQTTADILDARGYQVAVAEDGARAIELVRETCFDLALLDIKLPGMNGVETYRELKKISPAIRAVMMTAYAVENLVTEALEEGAVEVLYKPLDMKRIVALIESAKGKPNKIRG